LRYLKSPTNGAGQPITGAVVRVFTRVLSDDRGFRELPPVSTGQDGGYAYRAPRGPSRQILLTYTPFADDAQPAVIRHAVKTGVLSLVFLDAVIASAYGGSFYGWLVLTIALVAGALARKFAVT